MVNDAAVRAEALRTPTPQRAYRAPAARCPTWCQVTTEEHREERGNQPEEQYAHRRDVHPIPITDDGCPQSDVRLLWIPDNDWEREDPYGTDDPRVHIEVVAGGSGDGYTVAEALTIAKRLEESAAAIREAAGYIEAPVRLRTRRPK